MSKKKKKKEEQSVESTDVAAAEEPQAAPAEAEGETSVITETAPEVEAEGESAVETEEVVPQSEESETPPETEESATSIISETPLKLIVEAILFASQKPMSAKELIAVFKGAADAGKEDPNSPARPFAKIKEAHIRAAIEELEIDRSSAASAYEVRESAAGWQLVTKPNFAPWLRQLFPENRSARLSAPAMETLAIIAYRQPITRADIEAVRGVAVDGVMQTLLDRGLLKIAGRAEIPGRPLLYETTQFFMEHFGLKDLDDLPNAAELRKISLPTAEPPPAEAAPAEAAAPESAPTAEAAPAEATPDEGAAPIAETEPPPAAEAESTPEEPATSESEPEPAATQDLPVELQEPAMPHDEIASPERQN